MHRGFWRGNLKGIKRLERPRHTWDGGIRMDLKRNKIAGMGSFGLWIRQMEG
jgi:hypothetical protein